MEEANAQNIACEFEDPAAACQQDAPIAKDDQAEIGGDDQVEGYATCTAPKPDAMGMTMDGEERIRKLIRQVRAQHVAMGVVAAMVAIELLAWYGIGIPQQWASWIGIGVSCICAVGLVGIGVETLVDRKRARG